MPYWFVSEHPFECELQCVQCTSTVARTGARCKKMSCIGTPYCWQHLLKERKLRIKDSPIHGKGLFAMDPSVGQQAVIFKKGERIVEYDGERIDRAEVDRRFGAGNGTVAPYAVQHTAQLIEDGACRRGVGTIANRKPKHNNASLAWSNTEKLFYLRATANIKNGQEIFASYGTGYRISDVEPYRTVYRRRSP